MTDITETINALLSDKHQDAKPICCRVLSSSETADEFLKEAYRINSHIQSLLTYLQSIRHSYLSTTVPLSHRRHQQQRSSHDAQSTPLSPLASSHGSRHNHHQHLTDADRDSIDSSTALLLRNLSSSIANLSSAETLRQETEATLLCRKYGHANSFLWRWAGRAGALHPSARRGAYDYDSDEDNNTGKKSPEQLRDEGVRRSLRTVRENVLWYLRRRLERAAEVQRQMVEKRIERAREKERSILYKAPAVPSGNVSGAFGTEKGVIEHRAGVIHVKDGIEAAPPRPSAQPGPSGHISGAVSTEQAGTVVLSDDVSGGVMGEKEESEIESQLSPEQLQLFAEENDSMLKHYEDTLNKVQNAEKSLLEISSLQQTLVTHLVTQEEHISQLVSDAATTQANVGKGNKELKRATERRSPAQAVFWATLGLCAWLVVWDLIF